MIAVVPTFKDADKVNAVAEKSEEMKQTEDNKVCSVN